MADMLDPAAVRAAVARLREVVGRMTPGEWKNVGDFVAIVNEPVDRDPWEEYRDIVAVSGDGTANDLTGIAALRNTVPALLAVAEAAAGLVGHRTPDAESVVRDHAAPWWATWDEQSAGWDCLGGCWLPSWECGHEPDCPALALDAALARLAGEVVS